MRKFLLIILLCLISLFLYGKYIEVNKIKINYYEIKGNVPGSFKDLKIVHFSDILYDKNEERLNKIVAKINEEKADVIIFSGDLFKKGRKYSEDDLNVLKDNFKNLKASLYKIAIYGDNDYDEEKNYQDLLFDADFKLLNDSNMLFFYKDNTPINIIGLNDVTKIDDLLNTEIPVNYNLVITHKPDNFINLENKNINTVLSGHSLGGIINIPYVGGIIKKEGAKAYLNSYYNINDKELFISNGLGYEKVNFRLFNSPSFNVYHFS